MGFVYTIVILIGIVMLLKFIPINLWLRTNLAGVKMKLSTLTSMKLRGNKLSMVVNQFVKAQKAGVDVTLAQLEDHYLLGGSVMRVVDILVQAKKVEMNHLSFNQVAMADLADSEALKNFKK